jgi:hypothetical protein
MFYMPKLQSTFQKSHLQYIIWSYNKWRNKRTNHLQFKQNYCGLYIQLGTIFIMKAHYTNTQSSILIHSKWQKKHNSTNSQIATSTPTKTQQVSSGLHSVAAAADDDDDDTSCQVLALSRNTLPFKIRGGYCNSQVWWNPPPLYVTQSGLHQSVTAIPVTAGCLQFITVSHRQLQWSDPGYVFRSWVKI